MVEIASVRIATAAAAAAAATATTTTTRATSAAAVRRRMRCARRIQRATLDEEAEGRADKRRAVRVAVPVCERARAGAAGAARRGRRRRGRPDVGVEGRKDAVDASDPRAAAHGHGEVAQQVARHPHALQVDP